MSSGNFMATIITRPLKEILADYPVCRDFFLNLRIPEIDGELPLMEALKKVDQETIAEFGLTPEMIVREFSLFLETFARVSETCSQVRSITIVGGHDKHGESEIEQWSVAVGEVVSIVGPTGAGKSRLLADIECLADADTPTGRIVLVDGEKISEQRRFEMEGKLVAQLSQNMNFVMDLTVEEFLKMHAVSRFSQNVTQTVELCFVCANEMAGEKFSLDTKVTQLSGGQSRALMIADTAYMSASPIVLIDEIENAGIDRRQALGILTRQEKIVFISTHDPLLALSADKRIVIQNGGVKKIITTSKAEKNCLEKIEKLDAILLGLRNSLRHGEVIDAANLQNLGG